MWLGSSPTRWFKLLISMPNTRTHIMASPHASIAHIHFLMVTRKAACLKSNRWLSHRHHLRAFINDLTLLLFFFSLQQSYVVVPLINICTGIKSTLKALTKCSLTLSQLLGPSLQEFLIRHLRGRAVSQPWELWNSSWSTGVVWY